MYHSRDIAYLRADVRANCVIFLDLCKEAGLPVLITETVRDDEYQRYLAANGYASKTATRPTFHSVKAGLAFDICKNVKGHEYDDLSFFDRCGQIAKQVGFSWGGDWKSFKDRPHIQWDAHGKKTSPSNFSGWNIVEISCNLPSGTSVACGSSSRNISLRKLRYFAWCGKNEVTSMGGMFASCSSLTAIPQLDTSSVTSMDSMFAYCYNLSAIPQLNTSSVTNMNSMFDTCIALTSIPQLDTSAVTDMNYMFAGCYYLTDIAFNDSVTGWAGYAVSLQNCSLGHAAIVSFFNSLPTITSAKAITLTGNPGVSELTDAEKAIATGRGWTLTL